MYRQPVSVCTAAYNEEKYVGNLLEYLVSLESHKVGEILVCANACTDNTEAIIRNFSRRDKRVRLLGEKRLGKPYAWNLLLSEAKYCILVFLDGDVEVQGQCIDYLVQPLESDDSLIIVGGKGKRTSRSRNTKNFLLELLYNPVYWDYLAGGCYAVKKKRIAERMTELEFELMPDNIIGEDTWLESLLAKDEIRIEQKAEVHQPLGSFREYLRYKARIMLDADKFSGNYPNLARNMHDRKRAFFLTKALREISGMPNKDRFLTLLRFLLKVGVHIKYRNEIKKIYEEMFQEFHDQNGATVLARSARLNSKE